VSNTYYQDNDRDQRAGSVHRLFTRIARRYDLINDLQSLGLHRLWKRRLVRLAAPRPGLRALDLCCGTGDIARRLADAGADTTGLDFTAAMLDVARTRHPGGATRGLNFIEGDALALPFPDAQFDIVTIGYGLRNLADIDRGLAEMFRVLKPGGIALVLDFGKPDNAAWRALYFAYLRWLVPVFGWLFCGDAATHGYILESLKHYPGQRGVQELMRATGFVETRIFNLLGGMMSINVGRRPAPPPQIPHDTPGRHPLACARETARPLQPDHVTQQPPCFCSGSHRIGCGLHAGGSSPEQARVRGPPRNHDDGFHQGTAFLRSRVLSAPDKRTLRALQKNSHHTAVPREAGRRRKPLCRRPGLSDW
jgi:demethylmenaquinone methyltransferase/2-methoxy-6-polyprenyl-1,4-benzoquinol methylase